MRSADLSGWKFRFGFGHWPGQTRGLRTLLVWNLDSDLGVCGLRTIPFNFNVSFLA